MAHQCPDCGFNCHCGGDIDDLIFEDPINACSHCDDAYDTDDDGFEQEEPNYYGCNACKTTVSKKPPYSECKNCGAAMEEQYW